MNARKQEETKGVDWIAVGFLTLIAAAVIAVSVHQSHIAFQEPADDSKTKFHDEFPGLEKLAAHTDRRRAVVEQVNAERCPCGCGFTLATCLTTDPKCPNRQKNLARVERLVAGSGGKRSRLELKMAAE